MNRLMNRLSISLWTLLLVNAVLSGLLGIGLVVEPERLLDLSSASVKPLSLTLLRAIGVLLFGMSVSLWTLVDVRRTDMPSWVAKIAAVGLVFPWVAMLLISSGAASSD